jgi:hypothetical protein
MADQAIRSASVWTVAKLKPDFSIPGITTIPIPLKNGMVSIGSLRNSRSTRSLGVISAIIQTPFILLL